MDWFRSLRRRLEDFTARRKARQSLLVGLQDVVGGPQDPEAALKELHRKFSHFIRLLERNNQVLKTLSDLEEKTREEYLFDINYIRARVGELRLGVKDIIESMVAIGGADYAKLRGRYARIDAEIEAVVSGGRPVEKDDFILPLASIGRDRTWSVGAKSAGLGEMKSVLEISARPWVFFDEDIIAPSVSNTWTMISTRAGSFDSSLTHFCAVLEKFMFRRLLNISLGFTPLSMASMFEASQYVFIAFAIPSALDFKSVSMLLHKDTSIL